MARKFRASRRHKIPRAPYAVKNGPAYGAALRERGLQRLRRQPSSKDSLDLAEGRIAPFDGAYGGDPNCRLSKRRRQGLPLPEVMRSAGATSMSNRSRTGPDAQRIEAIIRVDILNRIFDLGASVTERLDKTSWSTPPIHLGNKVLAAHARQGVGQPRYARGHSQVGAVDEDANVLDIMAQKQRKKMAVDRFSSKLVEPMRPALSDIYRQG